jgi:hypothetical protein
VVPDIGREQGAIFSGQEVKRKAVFSFEMSGTTHPVIALHPRRLESSD